jgi:hypothetical protein
MGVFFWRQFTRSRASTAWRSARFNQVLPCPLLLRLRIKHISTRELSRLATTTKKVRRLFHAPRPRLVLQPSPPAVGRPWPCRSLPAQALLPAPHVFLKLTTSNTLLTISPQTAALNTPPSKKILFRFSTPDNSCRAPSSVIAL